jgi:hypothetical protein
MNIMLRDGGTSSKRQQRFDGVDYSVTEPPQELRRHCIQVYRFELADLVANGHVTRCYGFRRCSLKRKQKDEKAPQAKTVLPV